jgi:hypothetical protein
VNHDHEVSLRPLEKPAACSFGASCSRLVSMIDRRLRKQVWSEQRKCAVDCLLELVCVCVLFVCALVHLCWLGFAVCALVLGAGLGGWLCVGGVCHVRVKRENTRVNNETHFMHTTLSKSCLDVAPKRFRCDLSFVVRPVATDAVSQQVGSVFTCCTLLKEPTTNTCITTQIIHTFDWLALSPSPHLPFLLQTCCPTSHQDTCVLAS